MKKLIQYIKQFAGDERVDLLEQKVRQRTRYITICLEDIFQSQNANAVIRTCEAFGIQDIHIIENKNRYQINPMVVRGSSKWLNLHKYNKQPNPTRDAIEKLKKNGYRIIATSPHGNNTTLENYDILKGKTAIIFGTEMTGISDTVKELADEFLTIPMFGFVESFNISVSAAIVLHYMSVKLRQSAIDWKLTLPEQDEIMLDWLEKTVKSSKNIINRYNEINNAI